MQLFKSSGETRPQAMAATLLVLVAALHAGLALWLLQVDTTISKPKKKLIEVTLAPAPMLTPASLKPLSPLPAAQPAIKKPPLAKAVKPKAVAKAKPIEKKPIPVKPIAETIKPAPVLPPPVIAAPMPPTATNNIAQATNKAPTNRAATNGVAANPVGTGEKATCVHCPKPQYPRAAQRRNLEGAVQVKLVLSADGAVTDVTILRSSGHAVLDESAVNDVREWRFNAVPSAALRTATQTINFKM
jgi:protein TonB